jgi:type VI secretion system protein VasD
MHVKFVIFCFQGMLKKTTWSTGLVGRLALVGLIAALSGCATAPKSVEIKGEADSVLNRDERGNSLSVAVRIYQLKSPEEFSRLTFDMLANSAPEADVINADLLDRSEAILVPGGKFSNAITIRDDAKYVGLIAFFREPDPYYWRILVEADKVRHDGLIFQAKDCYLALKTPKPAVIPGQPLDVPAQCERGSSSVVTGTIQAGTKRPVVANKLPASATTPAKH